MTYRLYTFVAHHYLSPLQCGLQTAHVVSELAVGSDQRSTDNTYFTWAEFDKTIIICGAGNHAGVLDAYQQFEIFNDQLSRPLPLVLFEEDVASMNGMATACGIVIPSRLYNVVWDMEHHNYVAPEGETPLTVAEQAFVAYLKSFRLA